jgi:hypothetical protein
VVLRARNMGIGQSILAAVVIAQAYDVQYLSPLFKGGIMRFFED